MIDKSGEWWKGESLEDLQQYLRLLTADDYPAERLVAPRCTCGAAVFRLHADADEGVARRSCASCRAKAFICDSGEYAADARLRLVRCPCRNDTFQLAVGFSLREEGDIRWITVGVRCVVCGVLGSPVEWTVDYSPTDHLFAMA